MKEAMIADIVGPVIIICVWRRNFVGIIYSYSHLSSLISQSSSVPSSSANISPNDVLFQSFKSKKVILCIIFYLYYHSYSDHSLIHHIKSQNYFQLWPCLQSYFFSWWYICMDILKHRKILMSNCYRSLHHLTYTLILSVSIEGKCL